VGAIWEAASSQRLRPYSSEECVEEEFCELLLEVVPRKLVRGGRAFPQEVGMGVARLKDSPSSEARIIAECAD
jgi:hypothetical protein